MTREEITQYEQLCQDWRHYDNIIWQLPTISGALVSIIITLSFQYIRDWPVRCLILGVGGFLLLSLTIALFKHRFFQNTRTKKIYEIENRWTQKNNITSPVQRLTKESKYTKEFFHLIPKDILEKPSWVEGYRGTAWLKFSMALMTAIVFLLAIFSVFYH